jgi:hypothetical protein
MSLGTAKHAPSDGIFVDFHDFRRICDFGILVDFPRFSTIFVDFPRFSLIFHDFPRFSKIFQDFPRFSTIFTDFPRISEDLLLLFLPTERLAPIMVPPPYYGSVTLLPAVSSDGPHFSPPWQKLSWRVVLFVTTLALLAGATLVSRRNTTSTTNFASKEGGDEQGKTELPVKELWGGIVISGDWFCFIPHWCDEDKPVPAVPTSPPTAAPTAAPSAAMPAVATTSTSTSSTEAPTAAPPA